MAQLVRAFRVRGHFRANLDPLGLADVPEEDHLELHVHNYGFSEAELDMVLDVSSLGRAMGMTFAENGLLSATSMSVRELYRRLKEIYCGNIGFEYMHIPDVDKCNWIRERIETLKPIEISSEERNTILNRLTWADHFERALAKKYTTAKRFGLEGAESFIPGLKALIDTSCDAGVESVVLGMPHRGRLNVLSSVMKKPLEMIVAEFAGSSASGVGTFSGDVKYHLGYSNNREINGKTLHMSLLPNPSHLETVNTVVLGKTRAKNYYNKCTDGSKSMSILLHGDAAFSGQGVVYETLGLGALQGYSTGGTVHIIVNNQVGFTTDPHCSRSSPYCSDIAKSVNAPVFHVNGDDPEAVVRAFQLAAEYRAEFLSDVVLDVVCYRQHGHNETDEPAFTQPLMYKVIRSKPSVLQTYGQSLQDKKLMTAEEVEAVSLRVSQSISDRLEASKTYQPPSLDLLKGAWAGIVDQDVHAAARDTGADTAHLQDVGDRVTSLPEGFALHPRLVGVVEKKRQAIAAGTGLDWSAGEVLAFGSLLAEGIHVRLSGQDVERGTFSHRHCVIHDQKTGAEHTPLNAMGFEGQQNLCVHNSNLSEYGVMGFELGYSMENPNALVIWEAQFGDFANGAQIMIDQYLSSMEDKWKRQSGLTLLLPHGYDGMGPEHSSARLERFLQLSSADLDNFPTFNPDRCSVQQTNWQVITPTTPANIFHALRRQVHRAFRKPLIVMSPKSLLRLPEAQSELSEFGPGTRFVEVYEDSHPSLVADEKVRKLVVCGGKVYYDLAKGRKDKGIDDIAIVRIEQINPFPFFKMAELISKYPNAEVVWCQEEPKNQGAYFFAETALRTTAIQGCGRPESFDVVYAGRNAMSSTSTGSASVHKSEQAALVDAALA
jgi:2-oxoglutarate dehydrogenase E1 component